MEAVTVCGRVPIWSPSACQMKTGDDKGWAPGVCLSILANKIASTKLSWRLTEANNMFGPNKCGGFTVLASGGNLTGGIGDWHALSLSFSGAEVVSQSAIYRHAAAVTADGQNG